MSRMSALRGGLTTFGAGFADVGILLPVALALITLNGLNPVPWLMLVLPRLPLTLGNAVMATDRTARDYFGGRAARVTPWALCRSLGPGNVAIGPWWGACRFATAPAA